MVFAGTGPVTALRGVGRIVSAITTTSTRPAAPNTSNMVRQPNAAASTPASTEPTKMPMPELAWKIETVRVSFGPR